MSRIETEVLDANETCQVLKMKKQSLYRLVRSGEVPAVKLGRSLKFRRDVLDQWLKEKMQKDTATRADRCSKKNEAAICCGCGKK